MKVHFLDESGDHNLSVIDPQYPLFVLGGVIVEQDYSDGRLTDELNAFKQALNNMAGLQLADLVVSPIGRHVMGKPDKEDWAIVHEKFRRSQSGKVEGFGLVVLPE